MNKLTIFLISFLALFLVITCYALQVENDEAEALSEVEDGVSEKQSLITIVETIDDVSSIDVPKTESNENTSMEPQNEDVDNVTYLTSLFELPASRTDLPSQLLHRKGYTVSYNKETMQPNWVAWHLTAEHADGVWTRPSGNAFHEDADVPSPRASNYDYKGSGWSRGHMCPAGDNRWDDVAMYESFSLSNICPQNRNLNSGDWNDIEQVCRQWAKKYGDIYIVCGPVFYRQEHETIGANKIPVPEAFFKVVLCLNGTPKGIGFVCKNSEGNRKTDFYVNTIRQVERITGYKFFPNLDESTKTTVFDMNDLTAW